MKILFLVPFPPRKDAPHGGARCVARLILDLAAHHRIGLIYFQEPGDEPLGPAIRGCCETVVEVARSGDAYTPAQAVSGWLRDMPIWPGILESAEFRDAVRRTVSEWEPDVVQAENLVMGQYLDAAQTARVLHVLDTGVAVARERLAAASLRDKPKRVADLFAWRRYERRVCNEADSVVTLTQRDRTDLEQSVGADRITVIPAAVEVPDQALHPLGDDPPKILFVGNYAHPPNVEAAERLIYRIFPAVRACIPQATLEIAGPYPPAFLSERGVTVTGWVPSVTALLDRAAVFVAPIASGGGMRIKVLEALAAGKAVIASPRALEGIDAERGREVIEADSDVQFANSILQLLRNRSQRCDLARGARRWAERNSGAASAEAFERVYNGLTGAPVSHTAVLGAVAC